MPRISDTLIRGAIVNAPDTKRIIKQGYWRPLPPTLPIASAPRTRDLSMFVQLNRGPVKPDPEQRIIDHDRTDRIVTQDHGIKVRLDADSVNDIRKPDLLNKIDELRPVLLDADATALNLIRITIGLPPGATTGMIDDWFNSVSKGFIKPTDDVLKKVLHQLHNIKFVDKHKRIEAVTDAINKASADQINALIDEIQIPLSEELRSNKINVTRWFIDMYTTQLEPSKEKQDKIMAILEDIKNKPAATADKGDDIKESGAQASSSSQSSSNIITPEMWKTMSKEKQTELLQQAAKAYMSAVGEIKQGDNVDKMNDDWVFISGKRKQIPIRGVKYNMNKGTHVLDLDKFTIKKA